MAPSYHCPHCEGLLNPGTKVIFVIEHGDNRGLILLSPDLGDYAIVLAESFPIEEGVPYDMRCPICHHDLRSELNENLVEIYCRQPDGSRALIDFSRIGGEQATFVRGPGGITSFGEDAEQYAGCNFFGVGKDAISEDK